jgi:predicted nucleic acid-binding protein
LIFVDTSAWYALEVEDDENHPPALIMRERLRRGRFGALLTSDYVLDEVVTLLRTRESVEASFRFAENVLRSRAVSVVWIDRPIFDAALKLLKDRPDKRWSFTDCTSFVIMSQLGVSEAFAFDRNFEQAGFTKLP